MNNMWQLSGKKTDRKSSMKATFREFEKEISLMTELEDLKFLFNDSNYNCNVYILKVHPNIKLDLMKFNKNGEWEKFSFETYKRMAREGHITPTYTICIESILH